MSEPWSELVFSIASEDVDRAVEALSAHSSGQFYIEDYSDMEEMLPQIGRVDYIDNKLLRKDKTRAAVHLYLPSGESAFDAVDLLSGALRAAHVTHSITTRRVNEEDWADNWKQFYHAARIGEGRLVICPSWEEYTSEDGDVVVRIDPGSSFGSGTHETTRLCLELVEKHITPDCSVLDLGCGSGILSLAALSLGAKSALGVDIEEHACKTALDNAALCGVAERFEVRCGDVLSDSEFALSLGDNYDMICANIVADVLIAMAGLFYQKLKEGGTLVVSGIIDTRADEVRAALEAAGLSHIETREENGWFALTFTK